MLEVVMEEKAIKEKKGFWGAFINFLAMGGFLVVLVVGAVIAVIVSHLTN
jgi:hypothetical protein